MKRARLLRVMLGVGLTLALAVPDAGAQGSTTPAKTVAGGYSVLRDLGAGATPSADYTRGWFASFTTPLAGARWLATGEVSRQSRSNLGVETQRATAILAGVHVPVITRGRLVVFGRGLVGVERFAEPGFTEWNLAVQPGAGIDVPVAGPLAARLGADYRLVKARDVTIREIQISAGIRLGGS